MDFGTIIGQKYPYTLSFELILFESLCHSLTSKQKKKQKTLRSCTRAYDGIRSCTSRYDRGRWRTMEMLRDPAAVTDRNPELQNQVKR